MAQTKARIRVAGRAYAYVAPAGTTAPVDQEVAPAAAFKEVGFTSQDGTEFTYEPQIEKVMSHQSDYPTRVIFTGVEASVKTEMQEWSAENFRAALGGGTATEVSAGPPAVYKFAPPAGVILDYVILLDIVDGSLKYRWVIQSGTPEEGLTIPLSRTEESKLEVTWNINGADTGDAWYLLTNDPAFAPAA